MSRQNTWLWMLATAGLSAGFFAILTAVAALPARIAVASLGGVFMGVALYLHGKYHRLAPPHDRADRHSR